MACSMIKKGVLGAALGAGALYAVFGISAPGYVRTAFHKIRHNVKHSVPVQFDIDRARDQIAELEPSIRSNLENLAEATVDVERLDHQIVAIRGNMATEKGKILALKGHAEAGDTVLAGNVSYTADDIKAELKQRLDAYKQVGGVLKDKEETLKAKRKMVDAATRQLNTLAVTKKALLAQISGIEARLKMIETTQASNEFNFDGSALARAKESVADLEKRLDVMAKTAEMEGRFAGSSVLIVPDEPGRDVLREIDAEFGAAAPKSVPTGEKSL